MSEPLSPEQAPAKVTTQGPPSPEVPTAGRAALLGPAELAAARAAAAAAPPLSTRQRDVLAGIFGPHLRELHHQRAHV
ncbi:hypothetical protein FHX81_5638 [Saccharothrix saharensis]|uniref:Uncharacterized protein n=1 Tax=Saccharothrix saharensis TaxID=571190 RepID=A0A543JK42_9PSEU|nr:hypothetical protein [Saccharothrix saharensis]TQM83220.1 hypothetical protein FHX81_5638 [Saccharothrix saharensis]